MRIFIYEHLTALGLGREPADSLHAMYREGLAMRDALVEDFSRIADVEVVLEEARGLFDFAVIIAPETDGVLLDLSKRFASTLLGPSPEAIELCSDKLALANRWRECGIPTPATTDREPTHCEAFPVVWKPRDGCGSTATFFLQDAFDLARAKPAIAAGEHTGSMILQQFVPGRAASLAFLCGPDGHVPLIPTFQRLSTDGRFHYLGGELPIPTDLGVRAIALGSRAIDCVPGLRGYIGVDLVLGDAPNGSQDFAIEINPRLTTSYVGLRALADFNIAEAMLRIANPLARRASEGCMEPSLASPANENHRWKPLHLRFGPDGTVKPADAV